MPVVQVKVAESQPTIEQLAWIFRACIIDYGSSSSLASAFWAGEHWADRRALR